MLTTELVEQVLRTIPGKTVGLLGDLFLDRYLDIDPARDEPSVETGLTAYQVVGVRSYPGALGTVLNNLAALGVGQIVPVAAIGDDGEGYELRQALARVPAVDATHVFAAPARRTPTYTKPMYGEKELNRLDIKNRTATPAAVETDILARLDAVWPTVDALIVLDQVSEADCGVVTARVRDRLAELGERDPSKFVLADSREQIGKFRNVCVKPNSDEARKAVPEPDTLFPDDDEMGLFQSRCIELAMLHTHRIVFGTVGDHGIFFTRRTSADGGGGYIVSAYPVTGPIDICGAGDSCSAGITSAVVSGLTHEQAAAFGNLVASITIQQIGVTGTATPAQVRARWREVSNS
ncbi:bifunctional heptose 7-phosphate kinase/heptose 1-phosphate adenyltransferase [Urbifossiella limnaea]|uniref:Bifunctional heptose 7-phosphate kinase/heptose 1-phosphate adenyltransferase n=1 Tax=Urbifossiella limnaea TaxID=2528023 RepID=A0A517XVX7_9BACT|nr:PfkB family carbohydrate kinase [Urbifossiella limnaea]QDU21646.1 bifunctional heptose 7-phosphate kinase/heptose 1-phosphate adenyltransferase [Urbifossiella limnaea]